MVGNGLQGFVDFLTQGACGCEGARMLSKLTAASSVNASGDGLGAKSAVNVELLIANGFEGASGHFGDERQDVGAAKVGETLLVIEVVAGLEGNAGIGNGTLNESRDRQALRYA